MLNQEGNNVKSCFFCHYCYDLGYCYQCHLDGRAFEFRSTMEAVAKNCPYYAPFNRNY